MAALDFVTAIDACSGCEQLLEVIRLSLQRSRALGCHQTIADALMAELMSARTPDWEVRLLPTEDPPNGPPTGCG